MKKAHLPMLTLLFCAVAAIEVNAQTSDSTRAFSVTEALGLMNSDTSVVVLDVRTQEEFSGESGHLANAILIPVQELEDRIEELAQFKDRTIIAYCRTGQRSHKAARILTDHGFKALNMEGGIVRWNELHFPVIREAPPKEE